MGKLKIVTFSFCLLILIVLTISFFEEFLFRGYPGFRNIDELLLLFAVGLGFAIAFKLSGNNLYISYFVNLPNAFLTYILKSKRFPVLDIKSTISAIITIILIIIILLIYNKNINI
jgi:ABC-type spermidine/putrescine transport system permease subunit II